jgi:hypothetical protein
MGAEMLFFLFFLCARLLLLLRAVETRVLAALLSGVVQWLCRVSDMSMQFACHGHLAGALV